MVDYILRVNTNLPYYNGGRYRGIDTFTTSSNRNYLLNVLNILTFEKIEGSP